MEKLMRVFHFRKQKPHDFPQEYASQLIKLLFYVSKLVSIFCFKKVLEKVTKTACYKVKEIGLLYFVGYFI